MWRACVAVRIALLSSIAWKHRSRPGLALDYLTDASSDTGHAIAKRSECEDLSVKQSNANPNLDPIQVIDRDLKPLT